MNVVVQKYGGSSVADLERIGLVADRVVAAKRAGYRVCVVVSAMGKTTDQLLALARQASPSPPRRELDMLLSVGERTTMALLAIALSARGEDAISFTGSQSGIITNDRHFDARIIEVRPFRIEDELSRGRIVIVAGYQGMSYRREITTLGRGGSDTTAVALAAALGAARCEIYSDVDGVYSADPRVVPEAKHVAEMGYEELQEMAESGAKVLNAEAVAFAKRERIAIYARRTSDPVDAGRETVVRHEAPREAQGVRAVVGDAQIAWLHGENVGADALATLLAAADDAQVPLRELRCDGGRVSAIVSLPRVPDWERARAALEALGLRATQPGSEGAVALVSLVGDGLTQDGRALRGALDDARALGAAPAAVMTSPFRVSLLVPAAAGDALTRKLHHRFCEG
ncbi:MAG: aspartate kinase [Polyangiales bacterium]